MNKLQLAILIGFFMGVMILFGYKNYEASNNQNTFQTGQYKFRTYQVINNDSLISN